MYFYRISCTSSLSAENSFMMKVVVTSSSSAYNNSDSQPKYTDSISWPLIGSANVVRLHNLLLPSFVEPSCNTVTQWVANSILTGHGLKNLCYSPSLNIAMLILTICLN